VVFGCAGEVVAVVPSDPSGILAARVGNRVLLVAAKGSDELAMSDSGRGSAGGSPSDGGDGIEYGELAVTLAAVLALVVAAALLPAAGLGGTGSDGGTGTDPETGPETDAPTDGSRTATQAETGTATERTPGGGSSDDTQSPLRGGSPSGVELSEPPDRTRIGSTQPSGRPLAQTPQFVVEAPRNAYWRQAAYGRYTGTAWERSPEWRSTDGSVPTTGSVAGGDGTPYRITLLQRSSSLPTAWRPERVTVPNRSVDVESSALGGVRTAESLPAGTTYRARSTAPPRSAERLRAAGTDYPAEIERRYTQVPGATPDRVGAFTDDLTAGTTTPYDTAVRVRDWLQRKPYSLNASHEPGEPIADQFIFEMESGYCQYYATSMVVMLRTQGIPARYVVGYAPGEAVGENRYLVTADRGHAWVEAYFPGVGWVRFDPTGSGRLPVRNPQPPYDVSLNRSAVAGANVEISVEKNDTPVVGAPVFVDDRRVGWTDADGRVATTLPYAAGFTVTARPPDATTKYDGERTASRATGAVPVDAGGDGSLRLGSARAPGRLLQRSGTSVNGSSRRYRSDTNVTLSVRGQPVAGGGITVVAAIRDVPVRDAAVTMDGERVGRTDGSGTAGISLSGVSVGSHTIGVRRGNLSATATLRVREPTGTATPGTSGPEPIGVAVEAPLGLPLPGGDATVTTTTRNGSPVANATVGVDGERVGRTDENGTLGVTLPVAGSAVVRARAPTETTARTTVNGLYRNAALVGAVGLAGLGALGWWLRRRGVTAQGSARRLRAALSTLSTWATAAWLRAAELLVAAGDALYRGLWWLAGLTFGLRNISSSSFSESSP
jgi:transglutaminase-like putative cysteine protease